MVCLVLLVLIAGVVVFMLSGVSLKKIYSIKANENSISELVFNEKGTLLFAASSSTKPGVYLSELKVETGEVIQKHNGFSNTKRLQYLQGTLWVATARRFCTYRLSDYMGNCSDENPIWFNAANATGVYTTKPEDRPEVFKKVVLFKPGNKENFLTLYNDKPVSIVQSTLKIGSKTIKLEDMNSISDYSLNKDNLYLLQSKGKLTKVDLKNKVPLSETGLKNANQIALTDTYVYAIDNQGVIIILDAETLERKKQFKTEISNVTGFTLSPDQKYLAIGNNAGTVTVLRVD